MKTEGSAMTMPMNSESALAFRKLLTCMRILRMRGDDMAEDIWDAVEALSLNFHAEAKPPNENAINTPKKNDGSSLERLVRRIHVMPIGDVDIHSAQEICWCHPTETTPNVWTHNAKDCREASERRTGERCSAGWVNIAEYKQP